MIVYGRNPVREAIRGPRTVSVVWATEHAAREPWLGPAGVERATAAEIERLAGSADHQGVCAEVSEYGYAAADELLEAADAVVVALDQVQDPRNLGAICRVAECSGAAGVVIGERRAAQVTAAVCRASAGAVEHVPVARVRNLADWLASAKGSGAWAFGAAPVPDAIRYDQPDYSGRTVLVLGGEGRGLRPRVAAACDELVKLPMRGRIGSLNVSAAAAVLLYEILHSGRRLDKGT
ncbi:MAG: 23S rRNA (guanosine(2251)-2'-O)-methyltransferase RlmB [Actinobacteria bacterium]|nr:23S rRNA (guanosine(2251)-2'-O)-methyltransferase RlmB [Actinomycetota bacterium]